MLLSHFVALTLALVPSLVSGALFDKNSQVKWVGPKKFKQALDQNITMVVAFVAPWCGHCQAMAPEYSQAALGLYPLVPFYAVDCDRKNNKAFCASQGVEGFPTVKLWARGSLAPPVTFDGERAASSFYYWTTRNIHHNVKKIFHLEDIPKWAEEKKENTRMLLVNNGKHIPLLWQVLSVKYQDHFTFAIHRDRRGKSSEALGLPKSERGDSRVLVYPAGKTEWTRYQGLTKLDSLSAFFDSIIDDATPLEFANRQAAKEEFVPTEKDLEIEREQDAQRIALAHGGFNSIIDFEEAVKKYGKDFHGKHGFPGAMGNMPGSGERDALYNDDIMKNILKSQGAKATKATPMMQTAGNGQVVFDPAATQVKTPAARPTSTGDDDDDDDVDVGKAAKSPDNKVDDDDDDEEPVVVKPTKPQKKKKKATRGSHQEL